MTYFCFAQPLGLVPKRRQELRDFHQYLDIHAQHMATSTAAGRSRLAYFLQAGRQVTESKTAGTSPPNHEAPSEVENHSSCE